MTISIEYTPAQYIGNGVTTIFAVPFVFYASSNLIVTRTTISTGISLTLAITTDYTVTGGSGSTGSITMVSAPTSDQRITIERSIPYTQEADFQENTAFPAETIEATLDKVVIMAQQTKAASNLALKFPATDPSSSTGNIPGSTARANAILSFDSNGVPSVVTLASLGSSINVSLTSPQNGDALVYNAGVWNNRSFLSSLGTNIASATTTAISAADSDFVTVTGTTTITSFGTPASLSRKHIWVVFSGALTLTHNATSLILPGGANITTAAGDVAECVHISGANWRVVTYQRASGQAVVAPASLTLGTPVATTSGTAIDFTGLPAGIKSISLAFDAVNQSITGAYQCLIGDSGGVETTGYDCNLISLDATTQSVSNQTDAFYIPVFGVSGPSSGEINLKLIDASTNTWEASAFIKIGTSRVGFSVGSKSLSATLDRVRFAVQNPSFTAGKVNIQYQ